MAADAQGVQAVEPEWGIVAPKRHDRTKVDTLNGMGVSDDLRKQYRGMPELLFWYVRVLKVFDVWASSAPLAGAPYIRNSVGNRSTH
jgi:hypothetical protein